MAIVIAILTFGLSCFSLGYMIAKDIFSQTKKQPPDPEKFSGYLSYSEGTHRLSGSAPFLIFIITQHVKNKIQYYIKNIG